MTFFTKKNAESLSASDMVAIPLHCGTNKKEMGVHFFVV